MSDDQIVITAQVTPNPNTLKFMVDSVILESGTIDFTNADQTKTSPLPAALFELEGVQGVMLGTNFISVTKGVHIDWTTLAEPVTSTIRRVLANETVWVDDELKHTVNDTSEDSEVVAKIKEILDQEIRPAVAMDGGDIIFHAYEDGVLKLYLQGACQSCPSATLTLKMGIENRLKEDIPDLKEVIQI